MEIFKKENRIYLKIIITLCMLSCGGVGITSNTVGVFYNYVASDLNILRGTYIIHNTIATFALAFFALFVPRVINKDNFRRVIIISCVISSLSCYLMSFQSSIWMFYLLGFLRGLGNGFFAFVALSLIINKWFNKSYGLITSIVYSSAGVAGAILSPLFLNVIENYGWRIGYKVMGICMFLFLIPFIFTKYTLSPKEMNLKPYGGDFVLSGKTSETSKVDKTLFIYIGVFAACIHLAAGNVQHLSAIANSRGYSLSIMSLFVSLPMIGNVTFKFIEGEISDRKNAVFANLFMLTVTLIGIVLLLNYNCSLNTIGTLLIGAVFAETAVGLTLITRELFGLNNFNKTYPIYSLLGNGSYAIAGALYGYLYDFTGSYDLGLLIGLILVIISVVMIYLGKRRVSKLLLK